MTTGFEDCSIELLVIYFWSIDEGFAGESMFFICEELKKRGL